MERCTAARNSDSGDPRGRLCLKEFYDYLFLDLYGNILRHSVYVVPFFLKKNQHSRPVCARIFYATSKKNECSQRVILCSTACKIVQLCRTHHYRARVLPLTFSRHRFLSEHLNENRLETEYVDNLIDL